MADTPLDVVNENDEVMYQALRSEIHANGWRHREVFVYYITPQEEVIFQIRGAEAETNPSGPTTAAGGHVEAGMAYEEAALAEMEEETGIIALKEELHRLDKVDFKQKNPSADFYNVSFRMVFGYVYHGKLSDLKIETKYGGGFVSYPLNELFNPTEEMKAQLKGYVSPERHGLYKELRKLVS